MTDPAYYVERIPTTAMYGVYCAANGQLVTWAWRKKDAERARNRLRARAQKRDRDKAAA